MHYLALLLYFTAVIIGTLLFGAIHSYAYTTVFLISIAASMFAILSSIGRCSGDGRWALQIDLSLPIVFWAVIAGYLLVTVLPLPHHLVAILSPSSWKLQQQVLPVAGEKYAFATIAPYVHPVKLSLARWVVYGLFFLGFSRVVRTRKKIESACAVFLLLAVFICLYGIANKYTGTHNNRIWWLTLPNYIGFGTYLNRNHFAGLMELALALSLAYAVFLSPRSLPYVTEPGKISLRVRFSRMMLHADTYFKKFTVLSCGALIGVSLLLSSSRGGAISAALGVVAMSCVAYYKAPANRHAKYLFYLVIAMFFGAMVINSDAIVTRFAAGELTSATTVRWRYVVSALPIWLHYPLTGVGPGNFQHVYPAFQHVDDKIYFIDHVCNDWVQLLIETGSLGFVVTILFLGLYLQHNYARWRTADDNSSLAGAMLVAGTITMMAAHSLFDFNLHLPANFLAMLFVLTIGHNMQRLHAGRHVKQEETSARSLPLWSIAGSTVLIGLVMSAVMASVVIVNHFRAELMTPTLTNVTFKISPQPTEKEIRRAIALDGGNALYHFMLAKKMRDHRNQAGSQQDRRHEQKQIIDVLLRTVRLNPFLPEAHLFLGWELFASGYEPDYTGTFLPAADRSMRRAAELAGVQNARIFLETGNYWVLRSLSIKRFSPEWADVLGRSAINYRKALHYTENKSAARIEMRRVVSQAYPEKIPAQLSHLEVARHE